ncbi:unnamed protein product [Kuraishia capsulata CBS 1993]|uniref:Zn(2)-C6 fungal-type domain-containing protein n=1 Tax=Kuraishia capsulata CBS 1993 TaxID=1382522 RepID=W6MRT4_9ASCO|nr:uncharacterized protein KUCA_T00005469001 [Kuraishia capsulata CBS 1993]CDK29481.1 unnamed protein product [Kuraishia capsulata CBS 1993]
MSGEYLMKTDQSGQSGQSGLGTPDLQDNRVPPASNVSSPTPTSVSPGSDSGKDGRKKRRKVAIACVFCRRSHMICDSARPCSRCVKRKIGHLCHYEPASFKQEKQLSKLKPEDSLFSDNRSPYPAVTSASNAGSPTVVSHNTSSNTPLDRGFAELEYSFGNGTNNGLGTGYRQDGGQQAQLGYGEFQEPFTNKTNSVGSLNQQPFFFSEHAGSEFSSLNEFLSMIDDSDMINTLNYNDDPALQNLDGVSQISALNSVTNLQAQAPKNGFSNGQSQQSTPSMFSGINMPSLSAQISSFPSTDAVPQISATPERPAPKTERAKSTSQQQQPVISDSARDKFFLTAADPTTEISPEERLKQVIKAKLDAGLLKPYNYAKGYARLQTYMDTYMNASSRQRILKPLSTFRPGFRAVAKTLKDIDLILVEENFERMLLDYDRVFTSMAIPACLWRRTGEIYRGNKEFASLVEVSIDDLKNGKLTIYEVMTEESSVNFWEKYGSIAFDKTQKAVLTSCNLRTRDGRKRKSCCFSFTIRRDRYNIPSCIVGNFIPVSQ